jgi:ABC-type methionine transport system ATPase subunit
MSNDNSLTHQRIRVRITKNYHQEPVIYRLVSEYGLTVNIKAAFLEQDTISDGWFDLELQGTEAQIQNGLAYFEQLKLEIWDESRIGNW